MISHPSYGDARRHHHSTSGSYEVAGQRRSWLVSGIGAECDTATVTQDGQHRLTGTRAQCLDAKRRWESLGEAGLEVVP